MENVEIAQIGDYWVVAYKDPYDGDTERTILAACKSKEEALEQAVRVAIRSYLKIEGYFTEIKDFAERLQWIGNPCASVKIPGVTMEFDTGLVDEVGAIAFDEESGEWLWAFR